MKIHLRSLLLSVCAASVQAQTVPSETKIASYRGLHHAAHAGDLVEIARLVAVGADLNVRDRWGRTPTHVAAYASHGDALRALAEARADMNALEGQAYDVVAIAAVDDNPKLMPLAIELGNDPGLTTSPYDGTGLIDAAAPLDHVTNLAWTALIEAVVLGDGGLDHQEIVRLLGQAAPDQNISDPHGASYYPRPPAREG